MKKMKRKQSRKEAAERERLEEEARLNDPEEQRRIQFIEQQEAQRMERDRILFEEKEKALMDIIIHKQQQQQQEQEQQYNNEEAEEEEDHHEHEYEYVDEEGPPEIIWQGNEIIFKKKKLRVRVTHTQNPNQDNTPTSNPLPPESQSESHTHVLHDVAQQIPNFGTEQDKAHCPFHLKTGACRFGLRCSRVHFYPDKSSTILIKNMYNGPGLACDRDQDEGLEVCSFCQALSKSWLMELCCRLMVMTFKGFDIAAARH